MAKYHNETYSKGMSTFVSIDPMDGSTVQFTSQRKSFTVSGVRSQAVNAKVTYVVPSEVTDACNECVKAVADSVFEIRFNLVEGQDFSALRTEALRLLDVALSDHYLAAGMVPNVNATLEP